MLSSGGRIEAYYRSDIENIYINQGKSLYPPTHNNYSLPPSEFLHNEKMSQIFIVYCS